jgi:hypothetical protein
MEKEHLSKAEFKTQTYQIRTSPIKEWNYVVNDEKITEDEVVGRRIRDFNELLGLDKKKPQNIRANLIAEEIIAIILYTGPMVNLPFLNSEFLFSTNILFSVHTL